eukprot:6440007-Prymnesium_polylepis.1
MGCMLPVGRDGIDSPQAAKRHSAVCGSSLVPDNSTDLLAQPLSGHSGVELCGMWHIEEYRKENTRTSVWNCFASGSALLLAWSMEHAPVRSWKLDRFLPGLEGTRALSCPRDREKGVDSGDTLTHRGTPVQI